jgi:hypothetical protein
MKKLLVSLLIFKMVLIHAMNQGRQPAYMGDIIRQSRAASTQDCTTENAIREQQIRNLEKDRLVSSLIDAMPVTCARPGNQNTRNQNQVSIQLRRLIAYLSNTISIPDIIVMYLRNNNITWQPGYQGLVGYGNYNFNKSELLDIAKMRFSNLTRFGS